MALDLAKLFRWPGGSNKFVKLVLMHMPAHRVYIEPFCGGASVFFAKEPAEHSILGDTDPRVIAFYKAAQTGAITRCPQKVDRSQRAFSEAQSCETDDLCCSLIVNKMSYNGIMKSYDKKQGPVSLWKPENIEEQRWRLQNATIVNKPFDYTMPHYDAPDAFHYVDPPWWMEYAKNYHTGVSVNPHEVYDVAADMQGAVMVVYNDCEEVRDAFHRKPFHCATFERPHSGFGKSGMTKMIMARNY